MKTPEQRQQYNANRVARYAADPEYRAKRKANHARWREANREHDLRKKRENYAANAEEQRARAKAWRLANLERVSEGKRAYYEANREAILQACKERRRGRPRSVVERNNGLKPTGFTLALKEQAIAAQGHACAICGTSFEALSERQIHADHCHRTGSPRGVLCASCNHGLGKFKDDPQRLRAAIAYLESPPLGTIDAS